MTSYKEWLYLQEMPLRNIDFQGNWSVPAFDAKSNLPRSNFHQDDISILKNPAGIEKIRKVWSKSKIPFDFVFYSSTNEIPEINPTPEVITVVLTGNAGGSRIPMTGWIIAHRLSHTLLNRPTFIPIEKEFEANIRQLLLEVYGTRNSDANKKNLYYSIGTMKSARNKNLINSEEFLTELFAQSILTNNIRFNPLPDYIDKNIPVNNETAKERWDSLLPKLGVKISTELDNQLSALIGQVIMV